MRQLTKYKAIETSIQPPEKRQPNKRGKRKRQQIYTTAQNCRTQQKPCRPPPIINQPPKTTTTTTLKRPTNNQSPQTT